jgi:serine/threonine-protein kinase RsbW
VTSSELAARDALQQLLQALKPLHLDPEERGTIELVVAEVLNNIVEHAYPATDVPGPIAIHCEYRKDGLHFEIRDAGKAMPGGEMPIGQRAPLDVDMVDLPEGGFGWFLIKDLAKDVNYRRVGCENHLHMRLAVGVSMGR